MQNVLPSNITEAGKKASQAAYEANVAASSQPSVVDALRQKIQDAYSSNQDVVNTLDKSASAYYSAPAAARETYQNIFNPFQREQLVSTATNQALAPYLSNSALYGQRLGRISDLINAGTNAYTAQVGAKQAGAQQLASNYQNLLNEYQVNAALQPKTETQVVEANGRKYLVNTLTGERIADLGTAPAAGGSSGIDPSIAVILARLLNPGGANPTGATVNNGEPKPTNNPNDQGFSKVSPEASSSFTLGPLFSPQKNWYYDPESQDWIPVTQ